MHSTHNKGFASGTDALLLAAFALPLLKPHTSFVELGCGQAFTSIALCLAQPHSDVHGAGFDIQQESIDVAHDECRRRGLTGRLSLYCENIEHKKALRAHLSQEAHVVVANPPYYPAHSGRHSDSIRKRQATHQHPHTLSQFSHAAAALLRHHGYFCLIYPPQHLLRLCDTLQNAGFGLRRFLPVHSRAGACASRILIEARKGAATDMRWESGLILHGETELWSKQALAFCPWLCS